MKRTEKKKENKNGSRRTGWDRRAVALCMSVLIFCSCVNLEVFAGPVHSELNQEDAERKEIDEELEVLKEKQRQLEEEYKKEREEHKKEEERLKREELNSKIVVQAGTADVPVWDGEIASSFAGGSGTEEDPYQISCVEELAYMLKVEGKDLPEKCYMLIKDIYINEGSDYKHNWNGWAYSGGKVFDGNGHIIYGLYNSQLFSRGERICNLTIRNAYYDTADYGIGFSDSIKEMNNCHIYGEVNIESTTIRDITCFARGAVGTARTTTKNCSNHMDIFIENNENSISNGRISIFESDVIENCENYGNITASSDYAISGIAYSIINNINGCNNYGNLSGGSCCYGIGGAGNIENCNNYGSIITEGFCCGIGSSLCSPYSISNCTNFGILKSARTIYGIGEASEISNCTNQGMLSSAGTVAGIGIIFEHPNAYDDNIGELRILNCQNYGELTGNEAYGIVDECFDNSFEDINNILIRDCTNYGELIASEEAAGIMACAFIGQTNIYVENCVNEGNITCYRRQCAGIINDIVCIEAEDNGSAVSVRLNNCINRGNITVRGDDLGTAAGIACRGSVIGESMTKSRIIISNCSNSGALLSDDTSAGIIGWLHVERDKNIIADFSISNCHNTGAITAIGRSADANGIIELAESTDISDCFNSGEIYAKSTKYSAYACGIVGHLWNQGDESENKKEGIINNCYNIGSLKCDRLVTDSSSHLGRLVGIDSRRKKEAGHLYNLLDYSGQAENGVTYLSKSQMKEQSNFAGFDFDTIWQMGDRVYPYPVLKNTPFQPTSPDDLDIKVSDGETAIQVTDSKGHAIKGATVKSISTAQEQKTTDDGLAKFMNLSEKTETFTVTAAGYPSRTESFDLEKCGHLCKIVMRKNGLSKAILTYNGNKYNLLVEEKKINEADKNTKFQIQCEAVENTRENMGKYTIEQEKKQGTYNKIAESEDGSFSLQTDKFQAGKQVYVCGYDQNNKELFRTQINLQIMKTVKKTEVTKMNIGKDLSFTVGDDVPIFGGQKITLNGLTALPVYAEIDDETMKIGFNVNLGKLGTDDKTKKRKWQGMKETLKKSLSGSGDTVFDDIKKYSDKEYKMSEKLGITLDVAGYAEGPVTGETLSGKIYICFQVSWGKEWQAWKWPPVVVALDLTGKVSGGGEATFWVEPFEVEGKVFAEGSAEGKLSAGLGFKYLVSAGGYGKLGTSIKYILFPKEVNGLEYWKASGELGLQFRALGKERGSLKIMDGEYYMYKRDSSAKRAAAGLQENDSKNIIAALTDQDSYTTIPHEQLASMEENVAMSAKEMIVSENSISQNSVSGNALGAGSSLENEETDGWAFIMPYADDWSGNIAVDKADVDSVFVQTSSYIDSMPQLVSCGEDIVMLYLDDYPTRNAQNASTLMYSLYNGQDNTWSVPRPVYDDGTADYNPTVCKKENGFYVMWNNGKTAVPDGEELSLADTADATDLYIMSYDVAAHTFTDGKAVTENGQTKANGAVENGTYEKAAVMAEKNGKNYYAWIENSAGNVFGMEGTNHIVFAEDTENMAQAVQITDVNKPVFDLKLGTVNDRLYLAYTYDKDGDVSDTSDTGLVILDTIDGTGAEKAIYEGSVANIQFDTYNGEKALLWYADGNYFMWNGEQVSALLEENEISGSSFQYFTGADGKQYISYIGSDEAGLNGYLLQYDTDSAAWGQPIQITETENYIEQLNSIAWNGKVLSVYNLVKANMEQENDWIQSCSLGSVLTGEYCDLSIKNVDYVSGDFQKNAEFPVILHINNGGTKTVETLKVSLLNSRKQLVTETNVPVKLLPGGSQEVECNLALPSDLENDTYYFAVEKNQTNCPERNEGDNSHEVLLGMMDIQTTAHLNRINGYYSIVASMVNKGLETGAVRLIVKNYKTGQEYYYEDIEDLEPGENYHLEIPLQSLDIPEDEENAVCVQAVSEDEKEIEGNNEAYVNIIPYTMEEDTKEPDTKEPDTKEPDPSPEKKEEEPATQQKIPVTRIAISGISQKIAAGKKIQLTANITPKNASDKNVTWHSSNKKYASVSSKGKVSVKKAGIGKTVTITATARDGSNVKATYKIKIMKNAVKKVTIKSSKKTVKSGRNLTLKAVVKTNGNSANTKIQWTSSNTKYATVNSKGVVKAKKAGKGKTVKITAKATDGSGKKATIKIRIQ